MSGAVVWALQNFVVDKVKALTGNDANAAALASAVVVCFIGWASTRGVQILKHILTLCQLRFKKQEVIQSSRKIYHIFIPQRCPAAVDSYGDYYSCRFNLVFVSVAWYLTEKVVPNGDVTAFRDKLAKKLSILPCQGVQYLLTWKGQTISYALIDKRKDEDTTRTQSEIGLELTTNSAQTLRDFIEECAELHARAAKKEEWKQRLWTHADYGSNWNSELTYNCKNWDTVVLPKQLKQELVADIDTFMQSEQWYTSKGIAWTRGILLHGIAGCGKTSIIKAISHIYQMDIYSFRLHQISDDNTLAALFRSIPPRSVVVMEDVDAMGDIVHSRSKDFQSTCKDEPDGEPASDTGTEPKFGPMGDIIKKKKKSVSQKNVTLSGVLNVLDGVANAHGRILIMTTNHPEKIDPALLRPGRCDMQLHLQKCTTEQVDEMFKVFVGAECKLHLENGLLTPAEVSNVLLRYHRDKEKASRALVELAEQEKSKLQKNSNIQSAGKDVFVG